MARAAKKATSRKKVTARKKKPAARKKAVVRKKVTAKKKPATAKQKTKKKTSSAGNKTTKKKTASKKKAAAKKKTVATKKPTAKKKAVAKKKPTAKKKVTGKRASKKKRTAPGKRKAGRSYRRKRGEEYMSPSQVEHFRDLLVSWRMELMQEVDRTVHHMQDDASNFPDPNDRATQEEEFALELRTRDRERKLIKKINDSLGALDGGDYGYCEVCGVEIGAQRLEARPTATLCIDCKTLDEIREKQSI